MKWWWFGRIIFDFFGGYVSEGGGVVVKLKWSSIWFKRFFGVLSLIFDKVLDYCVLSYLKGDYLYIVYEWLLSVDSIDDVVESYFCSFWLS